MDMRSLFKRGKFLCAQPEMNYRCNDGTDYHQKSKERPRTLDFTEYERAIRRLNGTDNPQLNAFDYRNSWTFFDDIQRQRLLETRQSPFRITKLNIFQYGAFAWIANFQLVSNSTLRNLFCWDHIEFI